MPEALKLQGVVLVIELKDKCSVCHSLLSPRKLEVKYQQISKVKRITFLITDVMYCSTCKIGYFPRIFENVLDPYGVKWTIQQVTEPKSNQIAANLQPKAAQTKGIPSSPLERVDEFILIQNSQTKDCLNCGNDLIKKAIKLGLWKKTSFNREVQGSVFYCSRCKKHMLESGNYGHILTRNPSCYVKLINHSITESQKRAASIQNSINGGRKSKSSSGKPTNPGFNQYGVFIHSNATRRWPGYSDE